MGSVFNPSNTLYMVDCQKIATGDVNMSLSGSLSLTYITPDDGYMNISVILKYIEVFANKVRIVAQIWSLKRPGIQILTGTLPTGYPREGFDYGNLNTGWFSCKKGETIRVSVIAKDLDGNTPKPSTAAEKFMSISYSYIYK